jgi:hypothetical protein
MRLTAITAGSNYLDIDAYACCVALAELLTLQGIRAVAYSSALPNYSVCWFLSIKGQIWSSLPENIHAEEIQYIVVDVSDPDYIMREVPLEQVIEVYDHHVGFESYWQERIGAGTHIEFIGAAATLIYREWKKAGLQSQMSPATARLLMAAILDNTLDLTSSNTTEEDREAYAALRGQAGEDDTFRAVYFSEVQKNVEADLQNALKNDMKRVGDHPVLPAYMAQLCVWDADGMLEKLPRIRQWLNGMAGGWMLNLIDIKHRCGYFVCDDKAHQKNIENVFDVLFDAGVAKTPLAYLRKEIIKKCIF